MRIVLMTMTALALVACQKTEVAANADATNDVAVANDAMAGNDAMATNATAAAATMNNSTYEYVRNSRAVQLSVDGTGNYIASAGKDHLDHGTTAMKDGKICFTSAMTKEGEVCWTDAKLAEGASGETVSDKGEKLTIKRVAYIAKTM
ncbi:MAG: hypothetical protein ABIR87_04990 [Sphingomicrobium sp.]